jgi:hypothetical protein
MHTRRRHLDTLFLINVSSGAKYYPSLRETIDLCVPNWNLHNFTMFSCSSIHCPLSTCVSAAPVISKSTDIFEDSYLNVNNLN